MIREAGRRRIRRHCSCAALLGVVRRALSSGLHGTGALGLPAFACPPHCRADAAGRSGPAFGAPHRRRSGGRADAAGGLADRRQLDQHRVVRAQFRVLVRLAQVVAVAGLVGFQRFQDRSGFGRSAAGCSVHRLWIGLSARARRRAAAEVALHQRLLLVPRQSLERLDLFRARRLRERDGPQRGSRGSQSNCGKKGFSGHRRPREHSALRGLPHPLSENCKVRVAVAATPRIADRARARHPHRR